MTTTRVVYPNDGWVSGVSDGLSLACSRCGEHPRFDWNIDDYVWKEVMRAYPDEWRVGVVCLPCFEVLADEQDVEEWEWRVREIQFTGKRATTVFTAAFCFAHGYRADGHKAESLEWMRETARENGERYETK